MFSASGPGNQSFIHTGAGTLTIQSAGTGVNVQGVSFTSGDVSLGPANGVAIGGNQMLTAFGLSFGDDRHYSADSIIAAGGNAADQFVGNPVTSEHPSPSVLIFGGGQFSVGNQTSADLGSIALGSFVDAKYGSFVFGDDLRLGPSPLGFGHSPYLARANAPGSLSSFDFGNGFNVFVARATGGVAFLSGVELSGSNTIAGYTGVFLPPGGGAWDTVSDANKKTDWQAADPEAFLRGIAGMNIRSWRYRTQQAEIRHVGPTAQDFRAAFGLGTNDTTISTVDADGAAMLAIQALAKRTDELKQALDKVDALEKRLAEIEALLSKRNQ